jgi:hypothetical protein
VIEVYRDTSALSEGAPLYHPPHAKKAYSAAARRTADLALAANHLAGLQNYSAYCLALGGRTRRSIRSSHAPWTRAGSNMLMPRVSW